MKTDSQVMSEVDLLEWLNIEKPVLDRLRREKNLPYVRLSIKHRVYFVDEVTGWLKEQQKTY